MITSEKLLLTKFIKKKTFSKAQTLPKQKYGTHKLRKFQEECCFHSHVVKFSCFFVYSIKCF